jgi:hypothetical protein
VTEDSSGRGDVVEKCVYISATDCAEMHLYHNLVWAGFRGREILDFETLFALIDGCPHHCPPVIFRKTQ